MDDKFTNDASEYLAWTASYFANRIEDLRHIHKFLTRQKIDFKITLGGSVFVESTDEELFKNLAASLRDIDRLESICTANDHIDDRFRHVIRTTELITVTSQGFTENENTNQCVQSTDEVETDSTR